MIVRAGGAVFSSFHVVFSDQSFNLKHSVVALGMIYIIVVTELVSLGHQQTTPSESSCNSSLDVGNKYSISGSRILRIAQLFRNNKLSRTFCIIKVKKAGTHLSHFQSLFYEEGGTAALTGIIGITWLAKICMN